MKKIPGIFVNKIDKKLQNNEAVHYSANQEKEEIIKDDRSIQEKLNEIFSSTDYIYKMDVIIKTEDKSYDTKIIGKNSSNIITMNNETIPIKNIIDIKKKKNE